MSTRLMPDSRVESIPSVSKPIEGVGTAIAAFVGLAPGGPVNRPIRISSWSQFAKVYSDPLAPENGPFMTSTYLAHAVRGFFENGGRRCWVIRAAQQGSAPDGPAEVEQALRAGLGRLAAIDEVTMVCMPDLTSSPETERGSPNTLGATLVEECERAGNRMAILDPPPGLQPEHVVEWRTSVARHDSPAATLYWPWIEVAEPVAERPVLVPPSGHVAGVWARTDNAHGIHRAPTDGVVVGARSVAYPIREDELEMLDSAGVNGIRSFPGRGIRIWGSRTLSSDPEWRYVNVRRLFLYVAESIKEGTRWAAFEPNDDELRSRLRSSIADFLTRLWSEGALFGSSPEEAFFVKCDEETNPPDVTEAGQVVVEIGFAPLRPSEFVVLRISQLTAGAAADGDE
jgi:phage tail sheath protein FI